MSKMTKLNCVEGGHEIVPEFSFEGESIGQIRCVVCGLVYMDSNNPEYSKKLTEELKQKNLVEVKND